MWELLPSQLGRSPRSPGHEAATGSDARRCERLLVASAGRLFELVDFFQNRKFSVEALFLSGRIFGVLDLLEGGLKGVADVGVRIVQPLLQQRHSGLRFAAGVSQAGGRNQADRAMLRRGAVEVHEPVLPGRIQLGSVMLDPMTHEVTRAGQRLDLSPTEFRLLRTLMASPNVLVRTRTLLKEVWGHQDTAARNVLRVTASRLRAKLDNNSTSPGLLRTVPGEGLVFGDDAPAIAAGPAATDAPVALEVIAELQELVDETGTGPLRQLNETFGAAVEEHLSTMRTALTNRDGAALSAEAHWLRGTSGSLGAQRVTRVCAIIEERVRAGDLTQMDELLQHLELELDVFEAAIAPLLGPGSG